MGDTITLEQWVSAFPGIQPKTQALWMAIRWEFEQQEKPMGVRQMFYRMSSAGEVEKTENGYRRVQRCLLEMRRARAVPYEWIADETRWQIKPTTYDNLTSAASFWAANYRRALWAEQPYYVEVWCEKLALSGVISAITNEYDVPLMIARGYSSETFLFGAAEHIRSIGKPAFIYHFGDYDPSGRDAARDIKDKLYGFGADFTFIEAAVTAEQVGSMRLPTRPTKTSDSRAKGWLGGSVELDAIPPNTLRAMVREVIERHIDPITLQMTQNIETEERTLVSEMASAMRGGSHFGTSTKTVIEKPPTPQFKPGQRVRHHKFGEGVVVVVFPDDAIEVEFAEYGIRKLSAKFAALVVLD